MKHSKRFFLFFLILTYSFITRSQKPIGGIYLTAANYENKTLSYAHPCGKDHRIKLNEFLGKDFITVKHNDTLHRKNNGL